MEKVTGWLDSNCTLEDRNGSVVMFDSVGYIVGVFSNEAEALQAWPKIKYNIEKTNKFIDLKYFVTQKIGNTIRYSKPFPKPYNKAKRS